MNITLQNASLAVGFTPSATGPRLDWVRLESTAEIVQFDRDEEIAVVVLSPEAKDDPKLDVKYVAQDGLEFEAHHVDADRRRAVFRWRTPLVRLEVIYELAPAAPVLRKTIRCTAGDQRAYIAGVRHWTLRAAGRPIAWPPAEEPLHQPAVLLAERTGLLATLEWSLTKLTHNDRGFSLEFRPGYMLEPGETREVTAGSLIGFDLPAAAVGTVSRLEVARQVFFAHLAERIKPTAPRPIKFTTWGPWLGQVSDARIQEILPDLQNVGTDLLHIDAGWQDPHFPYTQKLARFRGTDDHTWDRGITLPDRYPSGLLPMRELTEKYGMKLSLWFDTCADVFLREEDTWAVRDADGQPVLDKTWEVRWKRVMKQSLASEYGERLKEFMLEMLRRYDLHGVVMDNHRYHIDHATGRQSMANGWNAEAVQHRVALEIFDEMERERPGIYRFFCESWSVPWVLLHCTHLHASDPAITKDFTNAIKTDYTLRCLGYERRLAWRRHYDNFVPPWGVKGDIAGWSVQQRSAIPLNLAYTDRVPGSGEGWTQNLFTCFATTTNRDIRFCFRQMPAFDQAILKEWLAWDRVRAAFPLHARPLTPSQVEPDNGVAVITQVVNGQGVLYVFNQSFDRAEANVTFDAAAGFRLQDKDVPVRLVYPLKSALGSLSYGQTLTLPLIAKDCAVIEVGLPPLAHSEKAVERGEYVRITENVRRSFAPIFLTPLSAMSEAIAGGPISIDAGDTATDRDLAGQILSTLAAGIGQRLTLEPTAAPNARQGWRVIVGTFDGLNRHADVGPRFRETLYNRYIEWDGRLISAPLVAMLPDAKQPTLCLIAPRPEQLARLGMHLVAAQLESKREFHAIEPPMQLRQAVELDLVLPPGRPILRFRPVVARSGDTCPIPEDLGPIRFSITATVGGRKLNLWEEEVAPFMGPPWWEDRVISLADLAGQAARLKLTAAHRDGRSSPMLLLGYQRVAVMVS